MKKLKIAALFAAATIMLTACGADTRVAATIDGVDIPAGVYIYEELTAYYEGFSLQSEEDSAAGTAILDSTLEGVPARQWIADQTLKNVREFAAINAKFQSLGLSYEIDSYGVPMDQTISESIDRSWDEGDSKTLMPMGISKESFKQIQLNYQKRSELFNYYYGEGGEKAVPEAELKAYLTENNARIDFIEMELKDGEGNLLKSDGKAERKAMAEDYLARAQSGEDFNDILGEYTDWYNALTGSGEDGAGSSAEADPLADPADEVPPTNEIIVTKDYTYPSVEVIEKAFELQGANPDFAEPQYFIAEAANGETYYVVKLKSLFDDPTYYEAIKEATVSEMKSEEFEDLIDIWTRDQTVVINEKAVERYKPDMFVNS
jgi:hypothetical protein